MNKKISNQTIFNTVWNGLKSQGFKQSTSFYEQSCAYRSEDGCKCAAGWLIPDKDYDSDWEGSTIWGIDYFSNLSESKFELISNLQSTHDGGDIINDGCQEILGMIPFGEMTPEIMESRFRKIALYYNLKIPGEDNIINE